MSIKSRIAGLWAAHRVRRIRKEGAQPLESQQRTFRKLIQRAQNTQFGRDHGFAEIQSYQDFQQKVPIRDYEAAKSYFDRIKKGESDVSWPGKPLYLAKTSGTTSGAKYIPITRESIRYQIMGARDAIFFYLHETGNTAIIDGKISFLSGSPEVEVNEWGMKVGRLSGIVNHFVPSYLRTNQVPSYSTNCIGEWEEKVEKILDEVMSKDLRLISGIPPWVQMFFEALERRSGKLPLQQWPNLGVFFQGGVDYSPYSPVFDRYFGGKVAVVEVFPASEGFFALQDKQIPDPVGGSKGEKPGLLLNLDYGIFYEFIPMDEYHSENPRRLTLGEVELGVQYALVVSTNAGLWAYDIGDTVVFVSKAPYRLRVSGRVKHFISAFGEHVIQEEVNQAMIRACEALGAEAQEFTVCPKVEEVQGESHHEWWVEFLKEPQDMAAFVEKLDGELRRLNSYYADLREGNMLKLPAVIPLELGASREYMRSIGRLGGQNKFPKLSNHRKIAEVLEGYRKR